MGMLEGKTAIVTGGARGIGLAIAKRYHRGGRARCDRGHRRDSRQGGRRGARHRRTLRAHGRGRGGRRAQRGGGSLRRRRAISTFW